MENNIENEMEAIGIDYMGIILGLYWDNGK